MGSEWETAEEPDRVAAWVAAVRRALADWYARGHRPLPWRADRDPYRVLVSEVMLVQTTVTAVQPFYERFLEQFPSPAALAEADEAAVVKAWEGLGYYRRARQLHAAARRIVAVHGGRVPDDLAALQALPGVGRYIAGAVLSFAFDRSAPIVEANTRRVLARLLGWRGELAARTTVDRLWLAAERLVPPVGAGVFNQALMELGAVVCLPRRPSCLVCPVAFHCRARALGAQDELPVQAGRPLPLVGDESCAVLREGARVLLVRRAAGAGLWAGFWEFPTIHIEGADPSRRSFGGPVDPVADLRRVTGLSILPGRTLHELRYTVTKYRMRLTAFAAHRAPGDLADPLPGPGLDRVEWVTPATLGAYTLGSAARRLAAWLARHDPEH